MAKILTSLLGAAALCTASASSAATTIIDLSNPTGDRGAGSKTYSDGAGHSVIATGYASNGGATTNLYGKNEGGDEIGLGLTSPTDGHPTNGDPSGQNEIQKGAFIQLDVSNLVGNVSSALVHFGSTTAGETWEIFGSNTAGSLGTGLLTRTNDESAYDLLTLGGWGTYQFYDFVSLGTWNGEGFTSGNVLLGNVTLSSAAVPEPATWALMLLGFGGIGMSLRRRRKVGLAQIA